MVSRRNFFTITLIMIVLLCMFQAPEVLREQMYHYDNNAYATEQETKWDRSSVVSAEKKDYKKSGRYIVFIGDVTDDAVGTTVQQWCAYSKRYLESYPKLEQYRYDAAQMPEAMVIDSSQMNVKKDLELLEDLAQKGVHQIFCGLPDLEQLKRNTRLKRLLGIRAVLSDGVETEGLHLFDGLLLGGEKIYQLDDSMKRSKQDLELKIPWCQPASGTKTYMAGMMDDSIKNENVPAIIWRNSVGQARIFVVNGDYISKNTGIGFLEGMMYESRTYALYPVINAQNLVILNFPALASENEEEMMRLYSRTPQAVFRDLIWPGLSVTMEKSGKKATCMLAPQQDYTDDIQPDPEQLTYHMKLLRERWGEAGISGTVQKVNDYTEKLNQDKMFLDRNLPDYRFLSFYQDKLTDQEMEQALRSALLANVRTIFTDYNEKETLIGYQNANVTRQCATDDGWSEQTFSENLRLNSMETALGYSSIAVDMDRIVYPQSKEDTWEQLYDTFSSNINTYWKAYEAFDATTLAESDVRIRRFLALDYTEQRSGDVITLNVENFEKEAFFILRLHGEMIEKVQGAGYEKIQEGVYLMQAQQEQITITLEEETKRMFHN